MSGGTRYSESRSPHNEEERGPTAQTLVNSLGTVPEKSWDSAKEVLGQCQRSLGTAPKKSWDSAVWGQSWDSAVLGQSWTRAVLGQYSLEQYSLGTVRSWDSGLGTVVLGQWAWDTSLGTVVLGQ